MSLMTLSEKSETRRYGLLSSRVSQILNYIVQNQSLPDTENKQVLTHGEELLDKFILGSRLVEGDDFKDGLLPTPDSLKAFPYAVTTLRALNKLRENEQVSNALSTIRSILEKVINLKRMEDLNQDEINILSKFFSTLAAFLYDDLASHRLQSSGEPISKSELLESNGKPSARGC